MRLMRSKDSDKVEAQLAVAFASPLGTFAGLKYALLFSGVADAQI